MALGSHGRQSYVTIPTPRQLSATFQVVVGHAEVVYAILIYITRLFRWLAAFWQFAYSVTRRT